MQDLSVRMSASGSCRSHLCKISVCGSLVQDLSVMMSASGSCSRTSCARSLYEIRNRSFSSISRDGHARSPQRIALRNPKSQFHLHSAHSTRTISAEGCTSKSEIAILPAFRALDTHDLRRGLHFEIQKRNFICIPRTRHARSPQRVALRNPKSQFHLHSAHLTRTISAEGCTSKSKNAISPAFRALDTHDLRRGFTSKSKKRNFTCIPRTRHARSPQRVQISKPCSRSTAPATKS